MIEKDRIRMDMVGADEAKLWEEETSKGIYNLPLPALEDSLAIGQKIAEQDPPEKNIEQVGAFLVSRSPESHQEASLQAIDFLVPDGTPVLAADDGKVINFEIKNTKWGPSKENVNFLNYVTLQHSNGEYSQYCHLAPNSLSEGLEIGSLVQKGTQIAVTGKTGWTDRDHLHFMIFRVEDSEVIDGKNIPNPHRFKSLKPRFQKDNKEL